MNDKKSTRPHRIRQGEIQEYQPPLSGVLCQGNGLELVVTIWATKRAWGKQAYLISLHGASKQAWVRSGLSINTTKAIEQTTKGTPL